MIRIFALTLPLTLVACAASTPTVKPGDPAATAAPADQAAAPASDPAGDTPEGAGPAASDLAAPCAGETGRALVDCKKSQKAVKTKFLFKSAGGRGDAAADVGDDDDDDDDD